MDPQLNIKKLNQDWEIRIFGIVYYVPAYYSFAEVCEEAEVYYNKLMDKIDDKFYDELAIYRLQENREYLN